MNRHRAALIFLAALAAASLAPVANAAGRPPKDSGVACARTENTYCRVADSLGQPARHPYDLKRYA
ncbi:hypothetical protein [Cupriavidus sp. YR651]|uniref:hypothetical protein n=1 Tax=Cupriavidus sp. YR651 TaxID=1855315 RepID=UPI000B83E93F|nr:hypothetical protein [Cupriavidus sp. YR651]